MQESLINSLRTAIQHGNLEQIQLIFDEHYFQTVEPATHASSSIKVSKATSCNFEFQLTFKEKINEDYLISILKRCKTNYLKTAKNTFLIKDFIDNISYNSLLMNMYH